MGLDISHDAYHMSYSTFSNWRNALARAAGFEMGNWNNGGFDHEMATVVIENEWTEDHFEGNWNGHPPEDPLLILLVHSDCDGYIEPKYLPFLIARLEQLIDKLPVEDVPYAHWRQVTRTFIEGAQRAVDANERLEFF